MNKEMLAKIGEGIEFVVDDDEIIVENIRKDDDCIVHQSKSASPSP
jgi:hypothetical protein